MRLEGQPAAPRCRAQALARSSRRLNFRLIGERRAQFDERNAGVVKLGAAMHSFDHQLDLANRLQVVAHPDQVGIFKALVGNILREGALVIECDFKRRDPVVLPPDIFTSVFVIAGPDQNPIERQRALNIQRDALADAVVLGTFAPRSLQLALRIGFDVDGLVVALALWRERRARGRIVVGVIEKILMLANDVRSVTVYVLFRITSRIRVVL